MPGVEKGTSINCISQVEKYFFLKIKIKLNVRNTVLKWCVEPDLQCDIKLNTRNVVLKRAIEPTLLCYLKLNVRNIVMKCCMEPSLLCDLKLNVRNIVLKWCMERSLLCDRESGNVNEKWRDLESSGVMASKVNVANTRGSRMNNKQLPGKC